MALKQLSSGIRVGCVPIADGRYESKSSNVLAFEGRTGGLAVRPIIRQRYVRFQNAKAVTGDNSRHGFFASNGTFSETLVPILLMVRKAAH